MRNIRDVLRLRLQAGLSFRQIKSSTNVSVGACQKLIAKAQTLGLTWPLPEELDDAKLASLFYPTADTTVGRCHIPDWPTLHQELKSKGVTKLLLWEEYTQCYPNRCYSYSQFCDRYRHWRGLQKRSMRQVHKAGEKCFVDYAGSTIPVVCHCQCNTPQSCQSKIPHPGVLIASQFGLLFTESLRMLLPIANGYGVRIDGSFGEYFYDPPVVQRRFYHF